MDLLSFEGKKAFIDFSSCAALIVAAEINISISLDDNAIYESVFRVINDLEKFNRLTVEELSNIPFDASLNDEDIYLCDQEQIALFRSIYLQIAKSLVHQLLDCGYYTDGHLMWHYRGKLSSKTGVLFERLNHEHIETK